MTTPMPFSDDRDLAIAALSSLISEPAAQMLVELIDAIKEDSEDESRKAQAAHPRSADPASGPTGATGALTLTPADPGAGAAAGDRSGVAIPDSITPLVGWRAWKLDLSDPEGPELVSLHTDHQWYPGKALRAKCDVPKRRHLRCRCPIDPAPAVNCRCGIYGVRDLADLRRYVEGAPALGPYETLVLGRVALWGNVFEYEHGWRAEYAYPQSFFLTDPDCWGAEEGRAYLRSFEVPVLGRQELEQLGWAVPTEDKEEGTEPSADEGPILPFPDAPGLPAEVAAQPIGDALEGVPGVERLVRAVRRTGGVMTLFDDRGWHRYSLTRLGQLLALPRSELLGLGRVGHVTIEHFRAWRVDHGLGEIPKELPVEARRIYDPESVPEPAPPGTIENTCWECGTAIMARSHGRVLCETCRPINTQLSALRAARKRAEQVQGTAIVAQIDEMITKLEAQRPRVARGKSPG